jgi:hypothetical protein
MFFCLNRNCITLAIHRTEPLGDALTPPEGLHMSRPFAILLVEETCLLVTQAKILLQIQSLST